MATNQDYKNMNYDRLAIWVKKGSRDDYKKSAAELGLSLAMLVQNGAKNTLRITQEKCPRRRPNQN